MALGGLLCLLLALTVVAVGNDTEEGAAVAEAPVAEIVLGEAIVAEPIMVETGEFVSSLLEPVILSPTELVEDAIEMYEEKVTERTADILIDAEPTDVVRVLVRYDGDLADDAALSSVDVSIEEMTVAEAAALLENGDVEALEVDQPVELFADMVPWGVNRTGAPVVWNVTTGSEIAVGIVDTGVSSHTDLDIAGGVSVVGGSYTDTNGHGTAVAGVVAAIADDSGIIGVAPGVDLYAIKVMNGSSGQLSDVVAGVDWAIENDMDILVMSFGTEDYSQILEDALDDASDAGILLIAAAGNDGDEIRYPAAYDDVIAVGSVDDEDVVASSSNTGSDLELVAPGVDVNTTGLSDGYLTLSGTSLATPHVAGVAALLWSYNASLSAAQVRNVLRSTALDLGDAGRDDSYGYGLVQIALDEGNSSPINDSYFYEVWNITDYDTENETLTFWANGTGTYEDLEFAPGYYEIHKYLPEFDLFIIQVSENGSVTPLATIIFEDSWTANSGSSSDGKLWISSYYLKVRASLDTYAVECWDYDYDSGDPFDECYFQDAAARTACEGSFCSPGVSCITGDVGELHTVASTFSTKRSRTAALYAYTTCGGQSIDSEEYYVFDEKRTICSGSGYRYEGRYSSSDWKLYSSTISCGAGNTCDVTLDGETCSSASCSVDAPCRVADGYACSTSADCLTGHSCVGSICISPDSVDVEIIRVTPIQVVPDVDMVEDKRGFVVVEVKNSGLVEAPVTVTVLYDGSPLSMTEENIPATDLSHRWHNESFVTGINQATKGTIPVDEIRYFVFDFEPPSFGQGKFINASVVLT